MREKNRGETGNAGEKFSLNAGSLRALANLQREDLGAFKSACAALRESACQSVFINLARCSYMSSLFIGELAEAVMGMKSAGKEVHVEVSPEIWKILYMARLYHLFEYEISADIS